MNSQSLLTWTGHPISKSHHTGDRSRNEGASRPGVDDGAAQEVTEIQSGQLEKNLLIHHNLPHRSRVVDSTEALYIVRNESLT